MISYDIYCEKDTMALISNSTFSNNDQLSVRSTPLWKDRFNVQTLRGLVAKYPEQVQKILDDSNLRLTFNLSENEVHQLRSIKSQYDMDFQIASALHVSDNIGDQALGIASRQIQDYTKTNPNALNNPEMVPSIVYQNVIRSVELLTNPRSSSIENSLIAYSDDPASLNGTSLVSNSLASYSVSDGSSNSHDGLTQDDASDTVLKTMAIRDLRTEHIQPIDQSGSCLFHSIHHQLIRLGKISGEFNRSDSRLNICTDDQIIDDKKKILDFIFEDNDNLECFLALFNNFDHVALRAELETYFLSPSYWRGEVIANILTEHSLRYYAHQYNVNIAVVSENKDHVDVYQSNKSRESSPSPEQPLQSDWVTIIRTLGGSHFESVIIDD